MKLHSGDVDPRASTPPAIRAVWLAASLVVGLWFLHAISFVLIAASAVVIAATALNAPVTWMERRGLRRSLGFLACLAGILLAGGLATWFLAPRILDQAVSIGNGVPHYVRLLSDRGDRLFAGQPELHAKLRHQLSGLAPSVSQLATSIGRYSLSLVTLLLLGVTLAAMTAYLVINPRPLLAGLMRATPPRHRDALERAMVRSSRMVVGWLWSNVLSGAGQAVVVWVAMALLDVPGAAVWALLAYLAAFVPQVGPYIAALPPVLVAFAIDPWKGVYVLVFFVVLSELVGDVIMPWVRSETMDIHPSVLIVSVLAMGSAFGVFGALLAAPLAGIAIAFWREFYLARQPVDPEAEARVERLLASQVAAD